MESSTLDIAERDNLEEAGTKVRRAGYLLVVIFLVVLGWGQHCGMTVVRLPMCWGFCMVGQCCRGIFKRGKWLEEKEKIILKSGS